jgi:hypothetical protein
VLRVDLPPTLVRTRPSTNERHIADVARSTSYRRMIGHPQP